MLVRTSVFVILILYLYSNSIQCRRRRSSRFYFSGWHSPRTYSGCSYGHQHLTYTSNHNTVYYHSGYHGSAYYPPGYDASADDIQIYHSPSHRISYHRRTGKVGVVEPSVEPPEHVTPAQGTSTQASGNYGQASSPNTTHPTGQDQPTTHNPVGNGRSPAYSSKVDHPQVSSTTEGSYNPKVIYPTPIPSIGAGETRPRYHTSPPEHTAHDTLKRIVGLNLDYAVRKQSIPTFHYHTLRDYAYNWNDDYTVHHYYQNKELVPKEVTVESNSIVTCAGYSESSCPANTTSLCTNNGTVMCVTSVASTSPCSNEVDTNYCVNSIVICKDNEIPECKGSSKETVMTMIPCISTVKISNDTSYNSIVNSNVIEHENVTLAPTFANSESTSNITTAANTTETTTECTSCTVTVIKRDVKGTTTNSETDAGKETVQKYCVAILALPAKNKLTI